MVERNAPCPCGSGKKYKKCCARKEIVPQEDLVEKELSHVIFSYPDRLFKDEENLHRMRETLHQWEEALGQTLRADEIEALVFDYYLFIKQREQWNHHVLKEMNGTIRSLTRSTLTQWQHPVLLIGKVIEERGDYYKVGEVLGHQTYQVRKDVLPRTVTSDLIISIALRDTREVEDGLYIFNDVIGVHDKDGEMVRNIQELAEASGTSNLPTFLDEHMLDVYQLTLNREEVSVQEFMDNELTKDEQAVCRHLSEELEALGVLQMEVEVGQMVAISYLRRENPVFRKPGVIAAAVFKAMENYGLVEFTVDFTQKEVADLFGVSVASMAKHTEPIEMIVEFMIEELGEQELSESGPTAAYYIGTDPLLTERSNWEAACRVETLEPDSIEDLQQFMNQHVNERFIPKGKARKAQTYAYDAYEQEDEDARFRLATVAYFTDPDNVDALLLRAESAEAMSDAREDYERAIALGQLTLDENVEDSPWGLVKNRPFMRALFAYGIFLFEQEQFEEALDYFQRLLEMNPNDNQGARHLAIAAAIHDGQYSEATQLLRDFKESSTDQAVYRYLQWLFDVKKGRESEVLKEAVALNNQVAELIRSDIPRIPYPKAMAVVPGSMEEALYVSILLWPSGERSF